MNDLPLAVRIAAGLAATAVERARRLPQDLAELPVTAVSQALQISMRVQQRITDLAIKGDNAIAQLRSPAEEPPWAVFDEDVERAAHQQPADLLMESELLGSVEPARTVEPDYQLAETELAREWYEAEYGETEGVTAGPEIDAEDAAQAATEQTEVGLAPEPRAATDAEIAATEADLAGAEDIAIAAGEARTAAGPADTATVTGTGALTDAAADAGTEVPTAKPAAAATPVGAETHDTAVRNARPVGAGPDVLPAYPDLSLASVRARLRTFGADGLQALLDYELAHQARPEFVRMLTNRIGTVRGR